MEFSLTKKDALKAVNMKGQNHTFDRWMREGIAVPASPTRTRGVPAKWDGYSLLALELTKRLGDSGMELRVAAEIAQKTLKYIGKKRKLQWSVMVDLETKAFKVILHGNAEKMAEFQENRVLVAVIWMTGLETLISDRLGMSKDELFWRK